MRRKRYHNDPPPPGGVTHQEIELTEYVDHLPMPAKTTRLKYDRTTGSFVVVPDPPAETNSGSPDPIA